MKKLSKLLLTFMLFLTISQPLITTVQAVESDEQTEEQNEEADEEESNEEADEEVNQETGEGTPVEDINEPTINVDPSPNQLKRDRELIRKPVETPASVTGERFQGIGTVVDFTTHGSREIYTINTPDNSVFYLMIDWDMTENNVYFLTSVNDQDMVIDNIPTNQATNETPQETDEVTNTENTREVVEETQETKGSNATFWVLLGIMVVVMFGYQLFFGKLKSLNPLMKKKEEVDTKELEGNVDIHNEREAESYATDPEEEADEE